jgi:hypothetical protein
MKAATATGACASQQSINLHTTTAISLAVGLLFSSRFSSRKAATVTCERSFLSVLAENLLRKVIVKIVK